VLRKLPATAEGLGAEVVEVIRDGALRPVRTVLNMSSDRIAQLDLRRPLLYLVCMNGPVQNIFSLSLETGEMRQVTDNQAPNVSFSGVTSLPNGALLYARNLGTRDIWALRRSK
jgi:hypothetical protein